MKKIAIISVIAAYLVLNLGISMKVHYCGGSVSYIDFFAISETKCCDDKKASCCKDKIAYINPETIQSSVSVIHFSFPDFAKYAIVQQDFSFLSAIESKKSTLTIAPTRKDDFYRKIPLYLFNKVLII